jgi:hypothetical protein
MKTHHFNFDFLSNSLLLGLNVLQFEIQDTETDLFHPVFEIKFGFIFFTLSYRNIDHSVGRE